MNQQLDVPNWDEFTPEQKRLYQAWITSLEAAIAANIELMKSFNYQDISSEVPNKEMVSAASSDTANINLSEIREKIIPKRIDEIYCEVKIRICKTNCLWNPNREKCLEDCDKNDCT